MKRIDIDKWVSGYKVEACDWVDGKSIFVNVQYIRPGGRINSPEWEKTAYIDADDNGIFMVEHMLDCVAEDVARLKIPSGGRARIKYTEIPAYAKTLLCPDVEI